MILDNVKRIANERGVTLHQIETGCDPHIGNGTLAAWGTGSKPMLETVQKVADYLNCSVSELLKDEEENK